MLCLLFNTPLVCTCGIRSQICHLQYSYAWVGFQLEKYKHYISLICILTRYVATLSLDLATAVENVLYLCI